MTINLESYFNSDAQKDSYLKLLNSSLGRVNKVLSYCNKCTESTAEPLVFTQTDLMFLYSRPLDKKTVHDWGSYFDFSYSLSPINQCSVKPNRFCLIFKFIQFLYVRPKIVFLLGSAITSLFNIDVKPTEAINYPKSVPLKIYFKSIEYNTYLVPFIHPTYIKRNSIDLPIKRFLPIVKDVCK